MKDPILEVINKELVNANDHLRTLARVREHYERLGRQARIELGAMSLVNFPREDLDDQDLEAQQWEYYVSRIEEVEGYLREVVTNGQEIIMRACASIISFQNSDRKPCIVDGPGGEHGPN